MIESWCFMDFNITTDVEIKELSNGLGYWLWNIAVSLAPYDTGNLRSAITLNANSSTRKKYVYNALNAHYLHYLEMGEGPITKHTGFISERTVSSFLMEIIAYIKTGKEPLITSKPMVVLRESRHGAMFNERKILKRLKMNTDFLTGDDRKKLSQITFRSLMNSNQERIGGKLADISRTYKKSINKRIDMWFMDEKNIEKEFANKMDFSSYK